MFGLQNDLSADDSLWLQPRTFFAIFRLNGFPKTIFTFELRLNRMACFSCEISKGNSRGEKIVTLRPWKSQRYAKKLFVNQHLPCFSVHFVDQI